MIKAEKWPHKREVKVYHQTERTDRVHSAAHTHITSPFFRLPTELRISVYKLVFHCERPPVPFAEYKQQACVPVPRVRKRTNAHALLFVSRQIYREAHDTPYQVTTFRYDEYRPKRFFYPPTPIAMDQIHRLQLSITLRFHSSFQNNRRTELFVDLKPPSWISFGVDGRSFLDSFPKLKRLELAVDTHDLHLRVPLLKTDDLVEESMAPGTREAITSCLVEFTSAVIVRHSGLDVQISKHSCAVYHALLR